MKITIAGTPGSGKSTLAVMLSKALNLKTNSIGDMRRQAAEKKGITISEFNKLGETQSWTDIDFDNQQKKYGEENDDFIFESRLGWYFIPDSIKIFLDANEQVRARRIFEREGIAEEFKNVNEVLQSNKERIESDHRRYKKYYGISNPHDPAHFDIILDSTNSDAQKLFEESMEKIKQLEIDQKI